MIWWSVNTRPLFPKRGNEILRRTMCLGFFFHCLLVCCHGDLWSGVLRSVGCRVSFPYTAWNHIFRTYIWKYVIEMCVHLSYWPHCGWGRWLSFFIKVLTFPGNSCCCCLVFACGFSSCNVVSESCLCCGISANVLGRCFVYLHVFS